MSGFCSVRVNQRFRCRVFCSVRISRVIGFAIVIRVVRIIKVIMFVRVIRAIRVIRVIKISRNIRAPWSQFRAIFP